MGFYEVYKEYKDFDIDGFLINVTENMVMSILTKDSLDIFDFLALLSNEAKKHLELIARKANTLTIQHFGKTIQLFTPMYLANHCVNRCIYCGFNVSNHIPRKKLTLEEVEREAINVAKTGLKHILLLTGECRSSTPPEYIAECVKIVKRYFTSVSIEVYPMDTSDYEMLVESGVDGLTVFQEVYDEEVYDTLHLAGPKKNYLYRLDTPERGCKAKMINVNIGALLGLSDYKKDAFFTALHAAYLQDKYPDTDISVSLNRMRPHAGSYQPHSPVTDDVLVQIMLAMRLFRNRLGITISTRESEQFRNNLVGLGVTKMSAGVSTEVGGHTSKEKSVGQFEISDNREVRDFMDMLYKKGYQPVLKDWGCNGKW